MRTPALVVVVLAALSVALLGCKRSSWYQSNVELTRIDPVRVDDQGKPLTMDVEFSWVECPGLQLEVIRGGKDFAACLSKYKLGDKVPVRIEKHWDEAGFWDWDVHEMGGCARPPDPDDEASFDTIRECHPWVINGATVGFRCNIIPEKKLLAACPWFGRY
ncbi:MAG: hypothetical protein HY898_04135 [Deltaproteobacteria bacterium]|nr:hypothetical protein [Deltaproteobacteria bacterium]